MSTQPVYHRLMLPECLFRLEIRTSGLMLIHYKVIQLAPNSDLSYVDSLHSAELFLDILINEKS